MKQRTHLVYSIRMGSTNMPFETREEADRAVAVARRFAGLSEALETLFRCGGDGVAAREMIEAWVKETEDANDGA